MSLQTLLGKLIHRSEAVQRQALSESGQLNPGDAAAIFDSLTQKIKQEGDKTSRDSFLTILFSWTENRNELTSQLLEFLNNLAIENIPPSAVVQLLKITNNTTFEQIGYDILKKWSENKINKPLAEIAKRRLSKRK